MLGAAVGRGKEGPEAGGGRLGPETCSRKAEDPQTLSAGGVDPGGCMAVGIRVPERWRGGQK